MWISWRDDGLISGALMMDDINTDVAAIGVRLFDDAYLAWFSAEDETERAFRAWSDGSSSTRAMSYAAYRAALDREEAAARDLQRLWALSRPCRMRIALAGAGAGAGA
jgi:hypothetical protein